MERKRQRVSTWETSSHWARTTSCPFTGWRNSGPRDRMGTTGTAQIRCTMPRFARGAREWQPAVVLRKPLLLPALAAVLIAQGCTIQTLALRSVDSLFDNTVAALMQEGDLQFAESAIAGDMKLLE